MKKTLLFMMILAVLATGCSRSKSLNYSDTDPIVMALSGLSHDFDRTISVTSDYDITLTAINEPNHRVLSIYDGKLHGINVGNAKVNISNGYENMTVDVKVDLFIEPTFEFGCLPTRIKSLYGAPTMAQYTGSILRYIYTTNSGYSYACGQMDFLFHEGQYVEAQVYIRKSVNYLLEKYLDENFNPIDTIMVFNTIIEDSVDCCLYRNKINTNVVLGKYYSGNPWEETFMFYINSPETRMIKPHDIVLIPRNNKD